MPIEARAADPFTTGNLLIGFSSIQWERLKSDGTYAAAVDFGILASEELAKEIETLTLESGASGTLAVVREIVTRIAPTLNVGIFNFRAELAELIFGSTDHVDVSANAAQVVTNDPVQIPTTLPTDTFVPLANSNVNAASFSGTSVTCAPIVAEIVGTGVGTTGAVSGDFKLKFKPLILGDVSSITVAGVAYTPVAALTAGNQVVVVVGTGATSGNLQFGVGGVAANVTGQILATYTPSHTFANLTDYVVDPLLGRIRFLLVDGGTDKLKNGQNMHVDYTYRRAAGVTLKPFTRNSVSGKLVIRHLTDIGSNFRWDIPSVSILLNGDALTFGADDFVTGSLTISIADAGGTNRFGTMQLSTEAQSA